jgi:uncharacterized membrane protein
MSGTGAQPAGEETHRTVRFGLPTSRLEAFSDGVFAIAIAITLLVLDLKVPPHDQTGQVESLAHGLGAEWPTYVAYLSTFFIIGIVWLNHHAVIQLLSRTDHRLQVLNILLLLAISVLPWPTSVLAEWTRHGTSADQRTAVLLYGLSCSFMALTFNILWRYLLAHPELHKLHVTPELLATRNKRFRLGPFVYPIATAIGLLSLPVFLGINLVLAVLYLLPTPDIS